MISFRERLLRRSIGEKGSDGAEAFYRYHSGMTSDRKGFLDL
jgi:hypothetical protein